MTDRAQFEAMLEALINDDTAQAKEIFHNIVVSKSREIYEELLAADFTADQANAHAHNKHLNTSQTHEGFGDDEDDDNEEDDSDVDSDDEEEVIHDIDDAEDDADEIEHDEEEMEKDEEDEESEEGDMEDRVMDLEDALEDLKAEFEQLLHGGEEHDDMGHDDMGMDAGMGGDIEDEEMTPMMEYHIKRNAVNAEHNVNTKSVVDNFKNDMGGTVKNIARNDVEVKGDAGTRAGGTQGGLANPKAGDLTQGAVKGKIQNRLDADAGKTGMKTQVKGGGIDQQAGFDKEGSNAGTGSGDKGVKNKRSTIQGRVR